uniref:CYP392A11 cytochrome P450 2J6-like protein n=2 Tax=Tetranychus urticae TaxID=32264 RepID=T1JYN2_TETUR|nr:CYP392A11 cytochrome P450 2J6-like protein [Tetranychus urticae]AWD38972.1 CYP392A11 cytochrome P450 2J6-like protein [Tetranychus urticae]
MQKVMSLLDNFQVSEPLVNALIGIALFWLVKYLFNTIKRIRSLPPGPWGLPIVGYLPFLGDHVYLQFDQLSKKYGPVYCLKLGSFDVVFVCDWPHMKEAVSNDALLARPHAAFFPGAVDDRSFGEMSGNPWREHRRLSLHILRDVGLGTSTLETLVKEEIDQFLTTLDNDGKPVDFKKKISHSIVNNISILLFGHKYDHDDPAAIAISAANEEIGSSLNFAGVMAFLPWLTTIVFKFKLFNLAKVLKCFQIVDSHIQDEIDKHQEKNSQEVVDYIDGYLAEMKRREKQTKVDDNFSIDILRRNAASFYGAGTETVASTMEWVMIYLVKYPEYQDKIRSEIADVIGFERRPDFVDRNRMPFTMAFIHEAHRIGSVVANNLLRRASSDTKIGNHNIPKDSLVIFNFWSINRDPKLWPNPNKFDPTRFLTEDGTKVVKPPYLIPFGAGKRNCPGESLANVELFLYIVCIIQKYRVKVKPGTEISTEASFGLSRRPSELPTLIFEKISNSD